MRPNELQPRPKPLFFLRGMAVALLLVAWCFVSARPAVGQPTELFISEYVEGSSNNKAIEIYNGTGAPVDLSAYSLEFYFNGSTSPGRTILLSGSLADGDVYVVAHSSADPPILAVADQSEGGTFYNGDDAVVLSKGGIPVDVIGQVGDDPGNWWGTGQTRTQDRTLRRKPMACVGDSDPDDEFDPSVDYDGFPEDTFDGLGAHDALCVFPEPNYGVATVDGDPSEWDTDPNGSDFFVNMYRAAKEDKQIESYLFLRYDCTNEILYVLVLSANGQNIITSADDAHVKINGTKLVDGSDNNDGTPPDFAWYNLSGDGSRASGWEAAISLTPGSYLDLNVHTQIEGGETSAVEGRAVPFMLQCFEECVIPTISHKEIIKSDRKIVLTLDAGAGEVLTQVVFSNIIGLNVNAKAGETGLTVTDAPTNYNWVQDGAGTRTFTFELTSDGSNEWQYWVTIYNSCGEENYTDPVGTLSDLAEAPEGFDLGNYPNPFNPQTAIRFALPEARYATLKVYDALGREVVTLMQGEFEAGIHEAVWDGRDASGQQVSSGVYLYRLEAGRHSLSRTMTLLK